MLWTAPKTLEPQKSNRLKELRVRSGLHSRKVELSRCHVMPLSALSTMSLPSVQTVIKFTNSIPKIMVQFCYLRLYFSIDNVSRRLLQWIARIKTGLRRRPTTRHRTYSNQISTRLIPFTKKSYLHRAQWRYYFYLSRVRILVSPWLLTWLTN